MNKDGEGRGSHDRHEPYAWHEPTATQEQEHRQSHAGNGTVNHGPDDQSPEDGLDSDELALRRMLHQAVQTVEPRDGTLDHLRRAVPARRARKRQAVVGMAAAALFIGTAVPALVHVSNSTGSDVNPSVAGQASQAQGGASQGKNTDGSESTAGGNSGKSPGKGKGDPKGDGKSKGTGTGTGGAGTDPSATSASGAPVCRSDQFGSPTESVAAPDAQGAVYGTFRVVNVSTSACTVGGVGTVSALAQGAADATKISTARHVLGDAAAGLPEPSTEITGLQLQPGAAYEVKFAWIPSATCPTTGGSTDGGSSPSPSPTPTPDAGTSSGTTSTGTDSGVTTQMMTADGTAQGSVVVSHTTAAGSPTISATVSNACAGTVIYTGVLPGA
ncbi:hypothetical protein GCM10010276_79650 [Streptomyces longisporus]|uniref:DUF4232 domain-containing protein n=1 Tax=Streptomyces longisporus TaxID=1948 RepID=A0ABN3NB54_STRLO